MIDEGTETNTSFSSCFSEYFEGKHTHDLYACSLDDAPDSIENERECIVSSQAGMEIHGI